jgi:hypothetical protein
MTTSVSKVKVDATIAQAYLDSMTVNRRISESNVNAIASAMYHGEWHDDGTTVKFDTGGHMIDGQHRMQAVIDSGTEHEFFVIRGVDPAAMATLDIGKPRSKANILQIHFAEKDVHVPDIFAVASVMAVCQRWDLGVRGNSLRNFYTSNNASIVYAEDNLPDLVDAARQGKRMARAVGGATAQAYGAAYFLLSRIDDADGDDVTYFFDRLADGAGLEDGDPIRALREYLMKEARSSRQNMRTDVAMAYMFKAWNAFREGRQIKQIHYKIGGARPDNFPEPV